MLSVLTNCKAELKIDPIIEMGKGFLLKLLRYLLSNLLPNKQNAMLDDCKACITALDNFTGAVPCSFVMECVDPISLPTGVKFFQASVPIVMYIPRQ